MSWNCRVVEEDQWLTIREVYSDPTRERIMSVAETPSDVSSETVEGLRWMLQRMLEACDKPIVNADLTGDVRMIGDEKK